MTDPQRETQYSESLPLKPVVDYVMLTRWPQDGDEWIHPEDRSLAAGMIPSERIFRRELQADGYYELTYGPRKIRVRPVMFEDAPHPVFEIGQFVKLKMAFESDRTEVGRIYAIRYSQYHDAPQYYLIRGDLKSRTPYLADALELFTPEGRLREHDEYEQWNPPPQQGG
ncbi:hypothetical protein LOC68_13455 [Blastopirellula sp. JC732]|uniref:Uncharacterized protein n=1 Tax=Blastopirellula sediminis TaxID=2894196 RepID=A0A9X1MMP2_9BACT|nr:hypothetical protein [Blastopirellula sediminis]MCC9607306.1 hypothetical protein [Blastopirellula sediminis]MCC9629401.1 hypothetical protein [Blastopirellula sediminis]